MSEKNLQSIIDAQLGYQVQRLGGVPGVVAMATDRNENFYEGAAGVRELGKDDPMTTDSVFAIFSTTKAMTGALIMQLVEEGKISLADEAGKYAPEIDKLEVLEGFDTDGTPRTRPPKRKITVGDLILHTSGLCYEFFAEGDLQYRTAKGIPSIVSNTFEAINVPLMHDPGEAWTYGVNIDWLGRIIEGVRDKRLGDVMRERLFDPLGMREIGFTMSDEMKQRRATIHDRAADGKLTPLPDLVLPHPTPMDMGGHGLYATVGEYMKFIRMILNDGQGENGRVLKAETVAMMAEDGLKKMGLSVGAWPTSIPSLTNPGEFFPGTDKGWAYTFMTNREDLPTGRPAGSLAWAGLANSYYWIDRKNGIGGYWATQLLPFHDCASYPGFVEFETAVYRHRG